MVTFFVIFIVLIALNAAMLITSSLSARTATGSTKSIPTANEIKIYPIDLLPSDYKKAI